MEWSLYLESLQKFPDLVRGAGLTLELVFISLVLGFLLAVPVALARLSPNPLLRYPASAYTFFFRGTPLLVQIYLLYYGLGQFPWVTNGILWPVLREAFWCAIISFTLNTAAYQAELLRGAIAAVPHGEIEAARACGMNKFLIFRRITIPRALRLALPALGNEMILMLKSSAIVSTITLMDLMGTTRTIYARSLALELFFYAGVIYLVLTFVLTRLWGMLEWRLSRHLALQPMSRPAVPGEVARA